MARRRLPTRRAIPGALIAGRVVDKGSWYQTSDQQFGRGISLVGDTADALGRILAQVATISRVMDEIAASTREQATSLQQINTSVSAMDEMTQQSASMVERATAGTHSLSHEIEAIGQATERFRTQAKNNSAPLRKAS